MLLVKETARLGNDCSTAWRLDVLGRDNNTVVDQMALFERTPTAASARPLGVKQESSLISHS